MMKINRLRRKIGVFSFFYRRFVYNITKSDNNETYQQQPIE